MNEESESRDVKMDAVTVWMNSLANRKESTRKLYQRHFTRFCEWAGKTPDELRQLKFEEDQKERPWERSKVENMVRMFLRYLTEEQGLTNLNNPYYAIRSFFSSNGLSLNLSNGDAPTSHSSLGSAVPTPEDIRQVLNACDYIRDRSLVLFLKDSGLRTSDLPELTWGDLKPIGNGFLAFKIVTAKEGVLARGFVGSETKKVLMLYKKKRVEGTRRIPPEKDIEKHPVFALLNHPEEAMAAAVASARLSKIFELAGMRGREVSAHGLRKFWEQHVHAKKESYVKQLNGRVLSKVEKAYDWLTREQLFEIYQRNYDNLRVLSTSVSKEVKQLEERLRLEYEEKIEAAHAEIRRLKASAGEVDKLKDQMNTLTRQMERMRVRYQYMGEKPPYRQISDQEADEIIEVEEEMARQLRERGLSITMEDARKLIEKRKTSKS